MHEDLREKVKAAALEYLAAAIADAPKRDYIPPSGKKIGADELSAMIDASLDMWLTAGRFNDAFEEAFAKKLVDEDIVPRSYYVTTWLGANEAFLRVIKMEKVMMSLIIFLIILVASFSICISLYTSVLRKTREIGLSAAMGARPLQIAATYCFHIGRASCRQRV